AFPFVKYDQLFAPEFNAGAMENAGLVIHMDEMLFRCAVTDSAREERAMIVLHEMAHMWFGDLVTMRWWDDLWLNEAFATYCSYLATAEVTAFTSAWTTFCINEKTRGRAGDARPSRHPVSGVVADTDAALLNFDAISYNKGASLLRQLTAYLGRDTFFSGITDYFERHAWGNTNLGDLMQALELASGRQLGEWSERHLTSVGCPTLSVEADVEPASGNLTALELVQTEVTTDQRVGVGAYQLKGGLLVRVGAAEVELVGERTPVPSLAGLTKPDLLLANDSDFAYASIQCDASSLELLNTLGVSAFADSLPRALTWGALWDLTITAQLPPATFVELVNKSVSGESHDAVLEQLLAWAALACDQLVPCSESERLRATVSDALTKAAEIAEPLSGRRLVLARGEAAFSTTPQQLERVESWLAGPVQQHGLTIDADLRWHVIQRLVATGRRTEGDIEAEFACDSTAFGRFRADRALAAIPELGAKERAWRAATGLTEAATNRTVLEACLGFWQWNQRELCRPFVARYFAELDRVWRDCDTEIAHQMTTELFPATFVERETLELVDQHLVRADLPSGQRRILADARFDLVRALRASGVGDPVHGITRSEDIDAG
ncbi:MAG: M1 family aminopeptidase, partial [Candidatus Nanopelagicales bacterium]